MMNGSVGGPRVRPASSASSASSGSGSSKHVKCIGRYVLTGTTLGKGNFARVEAAVHTLTRSKVAVKIIETDKIKEEYVRKNLLREAQLMRRLRHPNIIRLYETMKTSNLYCLVTEVAEGGELLSHVRNDFKEKRLSEATTRPFVRQLVSALHHLHTSGVVHRDLKMENILLDRKKKQIKIVDFGLSNAQRPGSLLQTHCGSPEYAAPELFIPGREYGPEVDVWSLGVNMYAMLVGKLPFRSPRQGTRKRQKLLEQIQSGLTEGRERDMSHITPEGRDLLGKLLQPNPKLRVKLREVMEHPWVTKDGSQPLYPYKYIPPDQSTQQSVIEIMSTFLEVSQSEIREAVRRDRCDWMAAIYNLLMDQPDGRVVMQRLLAAGPEEQLVDAAHYQDSMEHFRLSQDASSETTPTNIAEALTAAVAGGSHSRAGYRHSIPGDSSTAYPSSTLPIMRHDKKRHHESRPLATPRQPLNPVQPPPSMRRASIGTAQITPPCNLPGVEGGVNQPLPNHHPHHHPELPPGSRGNGRRLPVTPSEEPYNIPSHDTHRPHSRAESEPNPLPLPWRPNIMQKTQHASKRDGVSMAMGANTATSPSSSPPHSRRVATMATDGGGAGYGPTPLMSPLAHIGGGKKKKGGAFLRPVRPISGGGALSKMMSSSVDAHLDSRGQQPPPLAFPDPPQTAMSGSYSRKGGGHRGQVSPLYNHGDQQPMLGWTSNSRIGSLPRRSKDIQALMQKTLPTSPYSSVQDISTLNGFDTAKGSITSVDIKQELFSHEQLSSGQYVGGTATPQNGRTSVSPHGSRVVSPHGSNRVSPHGSTRVSPHGSTRVSPHGSMQFPLPEGSTQVHVSPHHSRVFGKSQENLKVDPARVLEPPQSKRHHRSVSANPVIKRRVSDVGQSTEYYNHVTRFDQLMVPNGVHPHLDHQTPVHKSHHHHHTAHETDGRKSGKTRRHTLSGTSPSQHPAHVTEL